MAKPVIVAFVFGSVILVLAMMPEVVATFLEDLRNLRDPSSIEAELPEKSWLVVSGGAVIVLRLLALLFR